MFSLDSTLIIEHYFSYKAAKTPEYWIKIYPTNFIIQNHENLRTSRPLGRAGRIINLGLRRQQIRSGQGIQRSIARSNDPIDDNVAETLPVSEPFPIERDPVAPVVVADLPAFVMNDQYSDDPVLEENQHVQDEPQQDDEPRQNDERETPRRVENVMSLNHKNEEDDHFQKMIITSNGKCLIANFNQDQVDAIVIYATHAKYRQIVKSKEFYENMVKKVRLLNSCAPEEIESAMSTLKRRKPSTLSQRYDKNTSDQVTRMTVSWIYSSEKRRNGSC